MDAGRRKYSLAFAALAAGAGLAASPSEYSAASCLGFAAAAVAFGLVAVAYATGRPGLLGKRGDGSTAGWAWPLLWPYFLLSRGSFALYRLAGRRGTAVAEVTPGLWFARRPTRHELRRACVPPGVAVLDLAAEFPRAAVDAAAYRSLPLLDGCAVDAAMLAEGVAWVGEHARRAPVLVHCALGHGRTGSVVVAWFVTRGRAPNVAAAVERMRALRPSFGLSAWQRAAVERFVAVEPQKRRDPPAF